MRYLYSLLAVSVAACASGPAPEPVPAPAPALAPAPVAAEPEVRTVTVRDPELEREVARLRLQLIERDAQIEGLERRLDDAITEVVRAMARMRALATRAEAASAMAEAEVSIQQLRSRTGRERPAELAQAERLLQSGTAEFDKENYGGAVYLATQAKGAALQGTHRLAESGAGTESGETVFAVPVNLETTARVNLRAGPGTNFQIVSTVNPGTQLIGQAFLNEWLRATLEDGRTVWVHQGFVRRVSR